MSEDGTALGVDDEIKEDQAGEELEETDEPLLGARLVEFLGLADGVEDAPVIGAGGGPPRPGGVLGL